MLMGEHPYGMCTVLSLPLLKIVHYLCNLVLRFFQGVLKEKFASSCHAYTLV